MGKHSDPFAEMAKRQKALLARLKKAPVVEVAGVVEAMGPGGSQSPPPRLWTVRLALEAWRIVQSGADGGDVRTDRLMLQRETSYKELSGSRTRSSRTR